MVLNLEYGFMRFLQILAAGFFEMSSLIDWVILEYIFKKCQKVTVKSDFEHSAFVKIRALIQSCSQRRPIYSSKIFHVHTYRFQGNKLF